MCEEEVKSWEGRRNCYLVFDLVLLGVLERNVVFGKTGLALPVLQQNESDLRMRKRGKRILEWKKEILERRDYYCNYGAKEGIE